VTSVRAIGTGFEAARIGTWSETERFAVSRDQLIAYAAATNDEIPQHADGTYAPPAYAIVVAFATLTRTMAALVAPELLKMGVHGKQDFRFARPIEPGAVLYSRAVPIGFEQRSSGVAAAVRGETSTEDGELVVEQFFTCFVRGGRTSASAGEPAPGHAFPESVRMQRPLAQVAQTFDADQTYRYADASGDRVAMHLDDAAARAVGHPGIIIHGLCTMAFVSRAVILTTCPEDPTRLQRLAVRFSRPCLPGQTMMTSVWGVPGGRGSYAFESTTDNGETVIKDGWAEVGAAG
jgi:acyl dehydratase